MNYSDEYMSASEIQVYQLLKGELYLGRLLNGEYNSEDEARQVPEHNYFCITGSHFAVLNLVIDNITSNWLSASIDSFASLRNTIIPQIAKTFFGFLEGSFDNYYCVIDHAFSMVICIQPEDFTSGKSAILSQISHMAKIKINELREKGIYISAYLSGIHPGLLGIKTAYKQIQELWDYKRIINPFVELLQYDDLDQPLIEVSTLPVIERNELECYLSYFQSIRIKDYSLASEALSELVNEVFYKIPPRPEIVDSIYKTFSHMMFLSINEIRKNTDSYVEEIIRPERLIGYESSVRQIESNFLQVFKLLENYNQNNATKKESPTWYQPMLHYIEDNLSDTSLNVTSLAEIFNLKPAYLSSAFKKHSGIRLLDYINIMRVRCAKKQILSGSTVTQAAERSGFGSVLTMRRAFLKFEGTLPSKI